MRPVATGCIALEQQVTLDRQETMVDSSQPKDMKIESEPQITVRHRDYSASKAPSHDGCTGHLISRGAKAVDSPNNRKEDSFVASARSANIPIPNCFKRTESEMNLLQAEALAEFRDCAMFRRIVNGITQRKAAIKDGQCLDDIDLSLAHMTATHLLSKEDLECAIATNPPHDRSPPGQCTCVLGRLCRNDLRDFIRQNNDRGDDEMFEMDL